MAITTTFNVATFAALNTAIQSIDAQGSNAAPNTAYTINITGAIAIAGGGLEALNLLGGSSVTISGGAGGQTVNGGNAEAGFFVENGSVTLQNLTIENTKAGDAGIGGNGAAAGGGGAGLGGGLFVGSSASVTLVGTTFTNNSATGGNGGAITGVSNGRGGGGGMRGATGGNGGTFASAGGGGGLGFLAEGANANGTTTETAGNAGIVQGNAAGGRGGFATATPGRGGAGGASGGGGGASYTGGGGGGGIGGSAGTSLTGGHGGAGGDGGFGGGGGGGGDFTAATAVGGDGGFGGGGGGSVAGGANADTGGGNGGFGGGGGGDGGQGGFGAGNGSALNASLEGNGGGGLGAGGDVFVQQGGTLILEGGTLSGGSVKAGSGGAGAGAAAGGKGAAFGSGIFIQGSNSITFAPASGQTLAIDDVITDQHGSVAANTKQGGVIISGAGLVALRGANTYTGGTTITASGATLELAAAGAAGSGAISFGAGVNGTVQIDAADTAANTIIGQGGSDTVSFASQQRSAFTIVYGANGLVTVTSVANPAEVESLTGVTSLAFSNTTVNIAPQPVLNTVAAFDPSWTMAGIGDFNADGLSDLVWDQQSSGTVEVQFLNGTFNDGGGTFPGSSFGPGWNVVGVGDTNGDGISDLVYRNVSTGLVEVQLLTSQNGAVSLAGGGAIAGSPFDATFNVVAVGDFNNDGNADLVYQRASDGLVEIQFLNGNTSLGGGALNGSAFGAGWSVVGTGHFNSPSETDLVYQNNASGLVELQFLNGATQSGGGAVNNNPFGAGWNFAGVGDFNGDHLSDLVFQNASTGLVEVEELNGLNIVGGGALTNNGFNQFGAGWQVVGVGDFNGDGSPDLLYRNTSTGTTEVQLLHGLTPFATGIISLG